MLNIVALCSKCGSGHNITSKMLTKWDSAHHQIDLTCTEHPDEVVALLSATITPPQLEWLVEKLEENATDKFLEGLPLKLRSAQAAPVDPDGPGGFRNSA